MICFNCEQEIEDGDGDWRYSETEGNQYFCQTCLDTGVIDEDEWN